jgi:tRNA-modifying protein YgfZ
MADAPLLHQAAALAESAGVRQLADEVLRVGGDDARAWLNGQISNDVAVPQPGHAIYALVVSLKGRVVTDLFVLDRGDTLDLVLPPGRSGPMSSYLDGFVIMEDVTLEARPDLVVLSVQGPRAGDVAGSDAWPCARLGTDGRDVVVPAAEAERRLLELASAAEAVGGGAVSQQGWELARLRAGVPAMGVDFGEQAYPQEAGLKERAVAFGKGCYQGQEAVVMLEHRGKPPKKLVHLAVDASAPPPSGTSLLDGAGQVAGHVTSSIADPLTGTCLALGYLKRDHAAVDGRFTADGAPAQVRAVLGG